MFEPGQVARDFSRAARQYDARAVLQAQVLQTLVDKARPLLPAGKTLLDAGCGTGRLALALSGRHLIQLDIAPAMCELARARGPAVNGSIAALPFGDGAFGGVFSSLALQWAPDWRQAVAEMERVLCPGGLLAISTFGDASLRELKESFAAADGHPHVSSFVPREGFESDIVTEYYPDLASLMRHLKAIGARNKLQGRRRSLMTPRQLRRVESHYADRFGTARGLPVTWEILYRVGRRQ